MPKDKNEGDRVIVLVFIVFQAHTCNTEVDDFANAQLVLNSRLGLSDLKRLSFMGTS